MNIFNYFKKAGIDTIDASFYRKIAEWVSWYEGNVRNFSFYKVYGGRGTYKRCRRKSMGMAKKLSEDIADLLLNERVTITLDDEATHNFVHQILDDNRFLVMGNDYQERKAFTGTVAYIPYLDNAEITEDGTVISGKISINYVDAPNIFPVSWNNGKVTECIFVFPHTIARKKYVQLQSHLLENGKYVIKNTVLRCDSGSQEGTELPEKEWKQLKPFKELAKEVRTGSSEAQFVIDRLNITNNADENNPMGVAIFANAIDTLKKLDIEYDSEENGQLKQITEAIIDQSFDDLENVTNSLGFYLDYGNGKKVLTPLSQVYTKYLDAACYDIVTGAFDYNSVLRRVVTQLTNSGLRQIDYSSGRANRVDVAARRAVMTGVAKLTHKITEYHMEQLGCEYVEVSWHAGARPSHSVWQGKVYKWNK